MTKQRPPSRAPDNSPFTAFTLCGTPLADMVGRASDVCLGACQAWHEETMRFVARRLERDAGLVRSLFGCRDWAEALRLQQEWAGSTAQDCFDQTRRLTDIAARLANGDEKSAATSRHAEAA